jgi:acyl dehydratase
MMSRLDETTVRFDDVEALNLSSSEEFGPWGPDLEVSQGMISVFADLTDDHQWIHVDVERANRESPFGAPIAHGFLTLALLPRLKAGSVSVTGHGSATNYGAEMLRFIAPVPAGSRIHGRSRLVRAEEKGSGTLATTEYEIRVVGADRPALLYRMQILYRD